MVCKLHREGVPVKLAGVADLLDIAAQIATGGGVLVELPFDGPPPDVSRIRRVKATTNLSTQEKASLQEKQQK